MYPVWKDRVEKPNAKNGMIMVSMIHRSNNHPLTGRDWSEATDEAAAM
jgi:hypothetical protein